MTDTSATWNDERVEQLKKLWAEGKSASQIAAEIGGISRNAVIGKVHRLGLAGRPKAGSTGSVRAEGKAGAAGAQAVPPAREDSDASAQAPSAADDPPAERTHRRAGAQQAARSETQTTRDAASAGSAAATGSRNRDAGSGGAQRGGKVEPVPEFEQHVTIMELREGMCRWPVGDPTSPEFRFCGARADIGTPYCDHHARIAYQPAADRRRERKAASG